MTIAELRILTILLTLITAMMFLSFLKNGGKTMTVKELILLPETENERYKGRFPAIELPIFRNKTGEKEWELNLIII